MRTRMKNTFVRVVLGVDIGSSLPMLGFVKVLQCSLFNSVSPLRGVREICFISSKKKIFNLFKKSQLDIFSTINGAEREI
tara:strand:- start:520 stop:759 length:240 start_codon:yes stop_codon:yes gene_type:complete